MVNKIWKPYAKIDEHYYQTLICMFVCWAYLFWLSFALHFPVFLCLLCTVCYRAMVKWKCMRLWFARDIWRYRNVFWLIDWLIEILSGCRMNFFLSYCYCIVLLWWVKSCSFCRHRRQAVIRALISVNTSSPTFLSSHPASKSSVRALMWHLIWKIELENVREFPVGTVLRWLHT